MVEQVNNNVQIVSDGIQVEEFATDEENKVLSETVDNLRKEADTAAVKTPKQPLTKNPESKVDIVESGDEGLSLFEDEAPAPKVKAPIQEPQKVVQEQKQVFTQKQESGELAKYDESAIALASQFIDDQFDEDTSIEDGLKDLGLLDLPEEEAANIIMQTAEILGEVETPESDTKMNFIEDVDALLMSRPQEPVELVDEPVVSEVVVVEETAVDLEVPDVITEAPKEKPVVAKKAPPAPKTVDPSSIQENTFAEPTLNQEIVEKKLEVSEGVLEQAKLEAKLQPKDIPEDMSEIEVEIQEEEKIEEIIDTNVASQVDSLKGELTVAEGVLSSEKAKLSGLGGNADSIVDQAVATSSVQSAVVSSAPKSGGEGASSGAKTVTTSVKNTNRPAPRSGTDNSGAIQTVSSNISAASGQVSTLSSQISALEAELDS